MAQIYTIKLTRNDPSTSWGFRLQGGKDFGTPLLVQKVNVGSLAEKSGLQAGDAILRVNNEDVSNKKHKEAQDSIVKAGNNFEITLQRGGLRTWKPAVIPIGSVPSPNPYITISPTPVTKTSLAAFNRQSSPKPPHGFNSAFNGKSDSENGPIKSIVNKQYNSPVAIYSDESIAETLSAQAEVLAGGVLGVNFKKNEKDYNAESSEVFKMVREAEKEPKSPEIDARTNGVNSPLMGLCHVSPPKTNSKLSESKLTPGKNICADCERLIVGVFVRIKDKNLHVECFKCTTCGTSLKNVGYYSIENKLYCDIHAKMIARQKPSTPNTEPIVSSTYQEGTAFKPFSPIPTNNFIKPVSPQPSAFSPVPFHAPRISPSHVTASSLQTHNISNSNGIKSFRSTQPVSNSLFKHGSHESQSKPFTKGSSAGANSGFKNSSNGTSAGFSVPRRGKGVWNPQNQTPGARIPLCAHCNSQIRGPFITALGKIWCPEHFICVNKTCRRSLLDIGFVEEPTGLYCEYCFEQFLAPNCGKCNQKVKGDCLNAIGKHFHPECFTCAYCTKLFGNNPFFLEDGLPYCENDWNELFTTKCFACGFPIEAGDRWVEALNNNYHSPCFNCTICKTNLEGQSFYAKGGRPFCKNHSH